MHVGITFDLRSEYLARGYDLEATAEFDRADTIDAIAAALVRLGHRVERIGSVYGLVARLAAGARWDLVFNIAEGMLGFGREAQVPALLDAYAIPYTFCDPLLATLSLHKGRAKDVLRSLGLPTPAFALVEHPADLARVDLAFPLFAKPVAEGTSKGCDARSIVRSREEMRITCERLLARFTQPVLLEAFLPGREFTVGLVGSGDAARSIGALEVLWDEGPDPNVYSYHDKEDERVRYRVPTDATARAAEALALACWRRLGGRDAGRVDLRCDAQGAPSILELNPLPGLHPTHSDLPILCAMAGVSYDELIRAIVESAVARLHESAPALLAAG